MGFLGVLWIHPNSQKKYVGGFLALNFPHMCAIMCVHCSQRWTVIQSRVYSCYMPTISRLGSGSNTTLTRKKADKQMNKQSIFSFFLQCISLPVLKGITIQSFILNAGRQTCYVCGCVYITTIVWKWVNETLVPFRYEFLWLMPVLWVIMQEACCDL